MSITLRTITALGDSTFHLTFVMSFEEASLEQIDWPQDPAEHR